MAIGVGRLTAVATTLALLAGLIANGRTVAEFVCKPIGCMKPASSRYVGNVTTIDQKNQLLTFLEAWNGQFVYLDVRLWRTVAGVDGAVAEDEDDDGEQIFNPCIELYDKAMPSDPAQEIRERVRRALSEKKSASRELCVAVPDNAKGHPKEPSEVVLGSVFAVHQASQFDIRGHFEVQGTTRMDDAVRTYLRPVPAEVALAGRR